jgi:hypothetical protein
MEKKKLLLIAAEILGVIGMGFAIWGMIHIVRFPTLKPVNPADTFKFCLGFGFMSISMWAIILLMPKSNKYSHAFEKFFAWTMGADGATLVFCSFFLL